MQYLYISTMLFLNILSLLYLTRLVNSRSVSETEEMNKIIEDILSKAEKKNAEPIKFSWTDRIVAENELTTPHYVKTRMVDNENNIFDLHVEPFLRNKPKLKSPPLSLQDIISQINRIQAQTDEHSFRFNDYRTKKDETLHTAVSRKANHSSKTRTHYRYKTTRTVARLHSNGIEKITAKSPTTQRSVTSLKPLHNNAFFGKIPVGVTKHISNLQDGVVPTTFKTSRVIKQTVPQAVKQTTVPVGGNLKQEVMESTKEISGFDMRPITHSLFTMNQYDTAIKRNHDELEFKMNNFDNYTSGPSFITAKHWGTLDSMEHLLNSVPNYDKTESLENIMNNIAREISSINVRDVTASRYKPNLKSLDELDTEMRNKPVVNTKTVLALKSVGNKYVDTSKMIMKHVTIPNGDVSSPKLPLQHSTSSYQRVPSSRTTPSLSVTTYTSSPYITDSSAKLSPNLFSTVPSIEVDSNIKNMVSNHSTNTDLVFLSSMTLKHLASTNSNFSSQESEHSTPSTTNNFNNTNDKFTSSDMYLLVNQKDNLLKGYFSINNSNADKSQHVEVISPVRSYNSSVKHKLSEDIDSTYTTLGYLTHKSDSTYNNTETADLYKEIMQLYDNIKPANQEKKDQPLHKKNSSVINWERIKKFFGHDRVCNCKCRENKTICRVCAASDAVIRELTFEFNNLAEYMQRHCTEIQTFFWMNPSGGKKLRDAVHKIDKSMQDYYKRVKGKCSGRTCKTFATYLDKRQSAKKKIDLKYLENYLEELSHRSDTYYNKIST